MSQTIRDKNIVALYLNPAEIVVAECPVKVTTVLGSCVSVTLFSPRTKIGSICHAVLPQGVDPTPGKFVDQAVNYMISFFNEKNISPNELVAKVFGGADMFPRTYGERQEYTIGAQNIKKAIDALNIFDLTPKVVETGGQYGRKLIFFSETGEVFVKKVQRDNLQQAETKLKKINID